MSLTLKPSGASLKRPLRLIDGIFVRVWPSLKKN
jgi:hypothetical protein